MFTKYRAQMRDVIRKVLSKGPGNAQVEGYFTAVFYRDKDKNGTIVREYTDFTGRSALHVVRKKNAKDVTELLNAFEVSGAKGVDKLEGKDTGWVLHEFTAIGFEFSFMMNWAGLYMDLPEEYEGNSHLGIVNIKPENPDEDNGCLRRALTVNLMHAIGFKVPGYTKGVNNPTASTPELYNGEHVEWLNSEVLRLRLKISKLEKSIKTARLPASKEKHTKALEVQRVKLKEKKAEYKNHSHWYT